MKEEEEKHDPFHMIGARRKATNVLKATLRDRQNVWEEADSNAPKAEEPTIHPRALGKEQGRAVALLFLRDRPRECARAFVDFLSQ